VIGTSEFLGLTGHAASEIGTFAPSKYERTLVPCRPLADLSEGIRTRLRRIAKREGFEQRVDRGSLGPNPRARLKIDTVALTSPLRLQMNVTSGD